MGKLKNELGDIIADGLYRFTNDRKDVFIEHECYVWLAEAYPEIMAEFHAVRDISE